MATSVAEFRAKIGIVPNLGNAGPYRFFFYSNESGEPHVHVRRERKLAKFWLEPVELADSKRFAAHELREIADRARSACRLLGGVE